MDKNAIKKYAVWARNELIARVSQKAQQYGITAEGYGDKNADSVNGVLLSATEKKQRQALIAKIDAEGFEQVMEEVAYTWFNRFTALRFMEVNNYLPSHTRVFTNEANEFKPQILADAISLDLEGLDMDKVFELKNANKDEKLYKYLLIVQCNALSSILPRMFQKIEDYTELLLPDHLLREGSVIERMIQDISKDSFDVEKESGQIEIIGWLYQYYISEKHDSVVNISNKGPVAKEDIPAATQLFTTDWVVKYIVDNSLGRYWIERNPDSKLENELEFYVSNERINTNKEVKPEDITFFDPCIGSGHFAIYAFDVFVKIYKEYGYTEREAIESIVKNNIYGLDVDERAAQLAYFSIMMKARQYDRRFLTRGIQPQILAISESKGIDTYTIDYFCNNDNELMSDIKKLITEFENAKEFGSLTIIDGKNWTKILNRLEEVKEDINLNREMVLKQLAPIIQTALILKKKYTIVATNPPYLNKYNETLKDFLTKNYNEYSADLFSVFMVKNLEFANGDGYIGFMTPFVWMYIKSYEELRKYIIRNKGIATLVQMEYSAYEEATVPICSFVLTNNADCQIGEYFDLSSFVGGMEVQKNKVLEAIEDKSLPYFHRFEKRNFERIEGSPIAFMASEKLLSIFESAKPLKSIAEPKVGLQTGNNDRFLRLWFEVETEKIGFNIKSLEEAKRCGKKWFPYNKGGDFRRWYGNRSYVVDWFNDGYAIKHCYNEKGKLRSRPQNVNYYFKPCITWSDITSASFSGRYCEGGFIFDVKGSSGFPKEENLLYVLGFLNSKISQKCIKILNPTITTQVGDMARIPVYFDLKYKEEIDGLVSECIDICKIDWDSFETSWEFKKHPLINGQKRIESAFEEWKKGTLSRLSILENNEKRLNEIFVEIYGLQDEITNEINPKDLLASSRIADKDTLIKGLISYAVGCMFGRYSLINDGVVDINSINPPFESGFEIDIDGIIPICDDEYFDDDIVKKFEQFIKTAFGAEYYEENLQYIASALGGKGTARDIIRNYFINDFFNDHCDNYSITGSGKRPIYWLFDSGKKNGFKCLVYMHKYKPDTIARIRTDYIHEQQSRYRTEIADREQRINSTSTSERVKLNKQLKTIQDKAEELRIYEEKIHHLADQMISIDLDDGVKENYAKFQDVLAKIK